MYPVRSVPVLGAKKKDKTVLYVGIATAVIIVIIVIVDIVMWSTKKGWFSPYNPPVPPKDSVSPNGNPNVEGSLQAIPGFILSTASSNLNQYQPTSKTPQEWGVAT